MLCVPVKLNTSGKKAGLSSRTFQAETDFEFTRKRENTGWNEVTALELRGFILGIASTLRVCGITVN